MQTNEVARAWALLPGLLALGAAARPARARRGAGLLLSLDRYAYRYGRARGAPGDRCSRVRAARPPALLERGSIVRRRGIDRNPVDVTTEEGARLLEAFVWPDQPDADRAAA